MSFAELNQLECRPPRQMISIDKDANQDYQVKVKTDLSDHVLAVGPRYQIEDVRCNVASHLADNTSGVLSK